MEPESLVIDENITEDEIFVIDVNTTEDEILEFLRQMHSPEGPNYWTVSKNGSLVEVGAPHPRKRGLIFRPQRRPGRPNRYSA